MPSQVLLENKQGNRLVYVSGIHKNKFEKDKFDNLNTSEVNLAWSIWNNAINEAALDVIGKSRKVKQILSYWDKEIDKLIKEREK